MTTLTSDGRETITDEMVAAMWAQDPEAVIQLVTLVSDALDEPIRVCDQPGGIESRSHFYEFVPFRLQWAGASREQPFGEGKLSIANVDSRIEEACDLADAPPLITLELVRAAAPDDVEKAIVNAEVMAVEGDETEVSGVLRPKDFNLEPACAASYGASRAPALY